MSWEQVADWAVLVLFTFSVWVANKITSYGERLTKVETVAVGTEAIRTIMRDETKGLHEDNNALRKQVADLSLLVEGLRADIAARRKTDKD